MTATVVPDMSEADYHSHSALSHSNAKLLLPPSCPALFRWKVDHPEPPTTAMEEGTAVHRLVLEGGRGVVEVDAGDWRSKAAKDAAAEARAAGDVPVLTARYAELKAAADAVLTHPVAGPLFESGQSETPYFWTDPTTGVELRARVDHLTHLPDGRLCIVDLKTSQSANPYDFERSVDKFRYYMQHPWYQDAVEHTLGERPEFLFVAVDRNPPHLVLVGELDPDDVEFGADQNRRARETYARCAETNTWPGFTDNIVPLRLPARARKDIA